MWRVEKFILSAARSFLGELPLDCIPVCNGVAPKMFDSKISDPLQK